MPKPTKKQTALLEYIETFTRENSFSPSYREIMRALHLNSVSAVAEHIENCVAAGFLKKIPNTPRSLEVIKPVDIDALISDLERLVTEKKLLPADREAFQKSIKILTHLKE